MCCIHDRALILLASHICNRIIDAVLTERLSSDSRLGEADLARLFGCSRTMVREALIELAARGIVTVSSRRGWFLRQITPDEAREIYEVREILEVGILRRFAARGEPLGMPELFRLKGHLEQQKAAIDGDNVGLRSYLLGDFHVCLAECLGNRLLAQRLRDLTVLTALFTMRYQTSSDAQRCYQEHEAIVKALEAGDGYLAEHGMCEHLGSWEEKVQAADQHAPFDSMRAALVDDTPSKIVPEDRD